MLENIKKAINWMNANIGGLMSEDSLFKTGNALETANIVAMFECPMSK